jgi:hypothetical protein
MCDGLLCVLEKVNHVQVVSREVRFRLGRFDRPTLHRLKQDTQALCT